MLDFISPLIAWSLSLRKEDIPSTQLRDVHHQHHVLLDLHKQRGGVKAKRIEQARLLNLFGAPVSQPWGSVSVCLHMYARRYPKTNWETHLAHVAVAEEAASRIGLFLLLQPEAQRLLWMKMTSILVYHARLKSFSPKTLKEVISIATAIVQSPTNNGVLLAPHLLDTLALNICEQSISHHVSGTRFQGEVNWAHNVLLHHAFLGLGTVYFSKVRSYNSSLGPLRSRVAFEAVNEIFKRHVKAADKPLRPDQLLRVRIEMPSRPLLGSVGLTRESIINHLPYAIAMVLIARGIENSALDWKWIQNNEHKVRAVAQRVECHFSECRMVKMWTDQINALGPLFANINEERVNQILGVHEWRNKLKLKKCIAKQRYIAFDPQYFQLDNWIPQQPTRVELFTTRGGKWPEERSDLSGISGRFSDPIQNILDSLKPVSSQDSLATYL
ncbi:MAG: hypothetical protein VXZ96_07600 [Myxococcota bacterium]|nr:hypothetical protein [Myxococcota bacterium]